eukprot:scaffold3068_cov401-Prasinococcus_capsulatus_cf.AAC.40
MLCPLHGMFVKVQAVELHKHHASARNEVSGACNRTQNSHSPVLEVPSGPASLRGRNPPRTGEESAY